MLKRNIYKNILSVLVFVLLVALPNQANAQNFLQAAVSSLWQSYINYIVNPINNTLENIFSIVVERDTISSPKPQSVSITDYNNIPNDIRTPTSLDQDTQESDTDTNTLNTDTDTNLERSPIQYVTNTYPTTIIKETVIQEDTSTSDLSEYITYESFERQLEGIFRSLESTSEGTADNISNSVSTTSITVSGGSTLSDVMVSGGLTMSSTTTGFLPPRLTTTQKDAIASPVKGLTIFDTTLNKLNVYNGTEWKNVGSAEIGGEVTSGTAGSVLFLGTSGILAQDNTNFSFNNTTDVLSVTGGVSIAGGTTLATTNQTGTGNLVLATSPTLVTPVLSAATATSIAVGANTLDTNEWAFLDGVNQTLATTSSPSFVDLTLTGGDITGANGAALDLGEATSGDITVAGDFIVADNSFIGLSSSAGLIEFDDQTTDEVNILNANVGIGDASPAALFTVGDGDDFQIDTTGDITLNQTTPNIAIGNTGTFTITDGTNTLFSIADDTAEGDVTVTGDLAVNGATSADITTSNTTATLFNTTATTINFAGAATTLNIGASATTILNFGGSTTAAEFRFLEPSASGTNYTALKAVAQGASITYSLPPTVGAAGTYLRDVAGDGVLTWAAAGLAIEQASSGDGNTAGGSTALDSLTAASGLRNTAFGADAGTAITTGDDNVLLGYQAGDAFTTVSRNIAIGSAALGGASYVASDNIAIGYQAGDALTSGVQSTVIGVDAVGALTTANNDTAVGYNALLNDTGGSNTAVGSFAGRALGASGTNNVAIGIRALGNSVAVASVSNIVAIGAFVLDQNTGADNTGVGAFVLDANTSGTRNTGVGSSALSAIVTANDSTAVGYNALALDTGGDQLCPRQIISC